MTMSSHVFCDDTGRLHVFLVHFMWAQSRGSGAKTSRARHHQNQLYIHQTSQPRPSPWDDGCRGRRRRTSDQPVPDRRGSQKAPSFPKPGRRGRLGSMPRGGPDAPPSSVCTPPHDGMRCAASGLTRGRAAAGLLSDPLRSPSTSPPPEPPPQQYVECPFPIHH